MLQVHSFVALGADRHPPTTLCNPDQARQAVEEAAKLGVPYRVALPTYSYRLVLDGRGDLLAATAEGAPLEQVLPPSGGRVVRLEADPKTLAGLVAEWRSSRPAMLTGIIWYRLPVPGSDRLNWSPATLSTVMAGREPHPRLVRELRVSEETADSGEMKPRLRELWLRNEGDADTPLPVTVFVRCPSAPDAVEGIGSYQAVEIQPAANGGWLISWQRRDDHADRRIAPGATLNCGWMRLDGKAHDEPTFVLPEEDEQ